MTSWNNATHFHDITPAFKYPKVVIPAKAGIQQNPGCWIYIPDLIRDRHDEVGYLVTRLIIESRKA